MKKLGYISTAFIVPLLAFAQVNSVYDAGNLVINAKSSQYGELIWKKNISLEASSFTYAGSLTWDGVPTMAEELKKDNQVYNTLSSELEKFYNKALNLAWQQIDPAEMKSVAEQAKKADKKGN